MSPLTDHGAAVRSRLSQSYGLSSDAVQAMMDAVSRGGGSQAQFNIPELGGMGQWQAGGMTMVGDMFNTGLKNTVNNLCAEISNAWFQGAFHAPAPLPQGNRQGQQQGGASMRFPGGPGSWWPAELGQPSSQGSQNNFSYAIFPQSRRLAVNLNGNVTVYDTGDHLIGGVGQQQSGDANWTFTSQYGTVYLNQLPVVSGQSTAQEVSFTSRPDPVQPRPEQTWTQPDAAPAPAPQGASSDQIFAALEKLGSLRDMGILTDDEFAAKKAELLSRL